MVDKISCTKSHKPIFTLTQSVSEKKYPLIPAIHRHLRDSGLGEQRPAQLGGEFGHVAAGDFGLELAFLLVPPDRESGVLRAREFCATLLRTLLNVWRLICHGRFTIRPDEQSRHQITEIKNTNPLKPMGYRQQEYTDWKK